MEQLVSVVALLLVGPMVGVELAVGLVVNPTADRLADEAAVQSRSTAAGSLGRMMPFWYAGSLAAAAVWTALSWGQPGAWLGGASAVLLAISVAMSIVLLVPINKRVANWATAGVPAEWKQQVRRWDRLHYGRVAIIAVALGLLVSGVSQQL
ncbi:DUF1772 domain-containing protein [Arthrobacter castelli]|uniref:DUF1772 domain-containing protein n=1 Tax=Arthrobacter castelli TaxID=271431 RepID=UPI000423670D|nr:DUF1772 domain-containing protein [Arthrobacter castelli]